MNRDQAKEILLRYRPGTRDAEDPDVQAALDFATRDGELSAWHAAHLAFQEVVKGRLRSIATPTGLRERILASREKAPVVIWFRSPALWAAAAGIVVLLSLSLWWVSPREDVSVAGFRERMVGLVLRNYPIQLLSSDQGEIRRYLEKQQVHGDYQLTRGLEKVRGYGCSVFSWQNRKVAMVCFEPAPGKQIYLFVANQSEVPRSPASSTPAFERVSRLTTATWSHGGKVYVLAAEEDEAALGKYLEQ